MQQSNTTVAKIEMAFNVATSTTQIRNVAMILMAMVSVSIAATVSISPSNSKISYSGRFDTTNPDQPRFDWTGVSISYTFKGATDSIITLTDVGTLYSIYLNGDFHAVMTTTYGNTGDYVVADNLNPTQTYSVKIVKRNEEVWGVTTLLGFKFTTLNADADGFSLLPTTARQSNPNSVNKIAFVGDSVTCGFGNLGTNPCDFTQETQDVGSAFPLLTASALGAEFSVQCWSGKGMVRNYGESTITSAVPLPSYYNRTVANDEHLYWESDQWIPDVVVINLGTNDYSTEPSPPEDVFVPAYINFINLIMNQFPYANIFAMCGPLIFNPCCGYVQNVVSNFTANVYYVDTHFQELPGGCSSHPDAAMHAKMADILTAAIQQNYVPLAPISAPETPSAAPSQINGPGSGPSAPTSSRTPQSINTSAGVQTFYEFVAVFAALATTIAL